MKKVIAIPVDLYSNGRDVAEIIQRTTFKDSQHLMSTLKEKLKPIDVSFSRESFEDIEIFNSVEEFMTSCNNQYINIENVWVAAVGIIS